jgi:hypothetical protein
MTDFGFQPGILDYWMLLSDWRNGSFAILVALGVLLVGYAQAQRSLLPQAQTISEKNQSGTRCTVFVDGRRACCLGGNDTPTCRIVMLPLACPLFVGLPTNGRKEAAAFHM